jgi:hypothetical protein
MLLSTAAVLFSTASAFAFLVYLAAGTSIGDLDYLLDKPPEHDMEIRVAIYCRSQ